MNYIQNKLEQSSREVVPTTLPLVLLIYSFQFRSAFLPYWLSQFHSKLSAGKHFLWPWTLTWKSDHELDLDRVKVSHRITYLGQPSFPSTVVLRIHARTQRSSAVRGPPWHFVVVVRQLCIMKCVRSYNVLSWSVCPVVVSYTLAASVSFRIRHQVSNGRLCDTVCGTVAMRQQW